MSEHTKEPWRWVPTIPEQGWEGYEIQARSREVPVTIADVAGPQRGRWQANARRIVACVNYCEGLDTEMIERETTDGHTAACAFDLHRAQVVDLMFRRDELRTALLEARAFIAAPQTHQLDPDEYAEADRITELLARIDAALGEEER